MVPVTHEISQTRIAQGFAGFLLPIFVSFRLVPSLYIPSFSSVSLAVYLYCMLFPVFTISDPALAGRGIGSLPESGLRFWRCGDRLCISVEVR